MWHIIVLLVTVIFYVVWYNYTGGIMLELEKKKDYKNDYEYIIKTDEGSLDIMLGGNDDLYWIFKQSISDIDDFLTFSITKDDYFIYNLFDEVYDSVKSGSPLKYYDKVRLGNYDFTKDHLCIRSKEKLFKDDNVSWHSDDYHYDDAPIVNINKEDDIINVTFEKGIDKKVNSIRFSNNGSQYDPFNATFMIMYNKLQDFEPSYHQIHIEEYIYNKEKRLKK